MSVGGGVSRTILSATTPKMSAKLGWGIQQPAMPKATRETPRSLSTFLREPLQTDRRTEQRSHTARGRVAQGCLRPFLSPGIRRRGL